jgi:segregation and condensation protein B
MRTEQLVEAALFVCTDPISLEELWKITGAASKREIRQIVEHLKKELEDRDSAIEIRKIGDDHYIMQARDEFSEPLIHLVKPAVSEGVLKTLSVIALKQPITQADVVKSRGYITYAHVKELVNKDFISAEPKGRTKLLTTTQKFADYFGLRSDDLTELKKQIGNMLGELYL